MSSCDLSPFDTFDPEEVWLDLEQDALMFDVSGGVLADVNEWDWKTPLDVDSFTETSSDELSNYDMALNELLQVEVPVRHSVAVASPKPAIVKKENPRTESSCNQKTYTRAMCPICQGVFFRKYEMTRHLRATHLRLKPHGCTKCSKTFSRSSHLKIHLKNVHSKQGKVNQKRKQ